MTQAPKVLLPKNGTLDSSNRTLQNDIGNMEKKISAILRKENISLSVNDYFSSISSLGKPDQQSPSPPPEIRYVNEGMNWGVIIPLILIGLILVIASSCLYWQSWKDKRRRRAYLDQQRHNEAPDVPYERSSEVRMSARSTVSQISQGSYACERPTIPLRRTGSKFYPRPEDEARRAAIPTPLSPIDELGRQKSQDTLIPSSSNNSKDETIRPLSSNLQMTWGTPRTSGTDSKFGAMKGYENPCFSAPGKLTGNVYCEDCNAMNSPYYPNNNTPTTEYDDSDKSVLINKEGDLPRDVYRGQTRATPLNCDEISSITTYPELSQPPSMYGGGGQSSSNSVSSSGTVSLPSSISRFHASRTQNTPNYPFASTRNCSPMRLNFTLSSSIEISDHYSDNTSMFPCVGSSSTSAGTQATSRNNIAASVYSDDIQEDPLEVRSRSASAPETRRPSIELMPESKSYSVEVDLFRSISLTADLSPGHQSQMSSSISYSVIQGMPHHPTPVSNQELDTVSSVERGTSLVDENQNPQGGPYDLSALPGRKVKFQVPVLDKKQYWV